MQVRAGTSGFSYKEWKGSFYPATLKNEQMLGYYAERLPTVEINNTFYRMPKSSVVEGWAAAAPEGFRFVIKASRRITHIKRLLEPEEPLSYLMRQTALLGDKRGPILFQLPPNMRIDLDRLKHLVDQLPDGPQVAFEFRHPSWFDEPVYDILRRSDAALCLSDHDHTERNAPRVATASWGYFRFRRDDYGEAELAEVADWMQTQAQAWREVYVFFKHGTGAAPEQAQRFMELLSER